MGKEGYWVIRTYTAGRVGEKIKYWVPGRRPSRSGRRIKSDLRKIQQNETSALRRLSRDLNANFRPGDLLLGLDYSVAGLAKVEWAAEEIAGERAESGKAWEDREAERMECVKLAAQHQAALFLRRVKRLCPEIKSVLITSDMDGDTGETVRVHHHLVIPADCLEACRAKWTLGSVDWAPLSSQPDYTAVAAYLLRQVRRVPDAKAYTPSRNLIHPQPVDRIAPSGAELRVPKNGQLLQRSGYQPGQAQYIRYILPAFEPGEKKKERQSDGAD